MFISPIKPPPPVPPQTPSPLLRTAGAVTCLTCPSFFLLPLLLVTPLCLFSLSLSRSRELRKRRLSAAAAPPPVPIWHPPSAHVQKTSTNTFKPTLSLTFQHSSKNIFLQAFVNMEPRLSETPTAPKTESCILLSRADTMKTTSNA